MRSIVKLLFMAKYLAENRNKPKKEVPIAEMDKNAIIMAHNMMLHTKGRESLSAALGIGYVHADKYAADSSSSEFFMVRDDHLSCKYNLSIYECVIYAFQIAALGGPVNDLFDRTYIT